MIHTSTAFPSLLPRMHLEGVVLRRDLVDEVVAQDGNLLHDVVAHTGHLCEEEERKEASDAAEACCETAAGGCLLVYIYGWVSSRWGMRLLECGVGVV